MTIEDDIAFLEQVPMLRRLGAGGLRSLAIGAESHTVQTGHALFNAGEVADDAFVVQQGSFNLKSDRPGQPDTLAGPGALLGESALLAEVKRPVTATAREPSRVMRISRAMFLKILESYPEAAVRLRELIAARTDQWAREIETIRAALDRDPRQR